MHRAGYLCSLRKNLIREFRSNLRAASRAQEQKGKSGAVVKDGRAETETENRAFY